MVDVLVVEDDAGLREAICDMLELNKISFKDVENGQVAEQFLLTDTASLVLSDVQMSPGNGYELLASIQKKQLNIPMILMTAYGSIPQAVDAMQAGAVDYLVKPFDVNNLLSTLKKQMIKPSDDYDAPVAVDSNSIDTLKMASRVAKTEATVLLNGESGVGKEVYSRYIHQQSNRKVQPFIAINCAAIPENMLEAALFGYDKGAFTGAVKSSAGKFEQAQGGTLLLDEITEMDLALQAKILRVIQEKEVERLGSSKMIQLNVRIIATSNRDLKAEVIAKRFREDLYYRLNVFPITIPPLRERVGDIMPLVQKILEQYNRAAGQKIQISEEACERLLQHQWSGNVRELDNVIQRALILKQGNDINVSDIMIESSSLDTTSQSTMNLSNNDSGILHNDLRDRETEVIIATLRGFKGSRKNTAEPLGLSPRTLRYKLARLRDAGALVTE